jgi:hypothetical protein
MAAKERVFTRPSIYFDRVSSLVEECPVRCRTDYEGFPIFYRTDGVNKLTWARAREVLRIIQTPVHRKVGRNKGFLISNQGPDNLQSFLPRYVLPYFANSTPPLRSIRMYSDLTGLSVEELQPYTRGAGIPRTFRTCSVISCQQP